MPPSPPVLASIMKGEQATRDDQHGRNPQHEPIEMVALESLVDTDGPVPQERHDRPNQGKRPEREKDDSDKPAQASAPIGIGLRSRLPVSTFGIILSCAIRRQAAITMAIRAPRSFAMIPMGFAPASPGEQEKAHEGNEGADEGDQTRT